jgi:hypothetical protein
VYTTDAVANDPFVTDGSLWGMTGTSGIGATEAWANGAAGGNCGTSFVGIIDEGYYYEHADLKDNAGKNPGEIAGNKIDDDGNGYVDDVYGYDFANNDNTVFDGTTDDHGTHVAGTIGAAGNNGIGVAGVCWDVQLLNAKFLGRNGGTTANAVKAVDYFTALKTAGVHIVATNNSWGGGGYSQALADAIGRRRQQRGELRRVVVLPGPLHQRQRDRRGVAHEHGGAELLLELWRRRDRPRCTGERHSLHRAGEREAQDHVGVRQLPRHLDGHAARDGCGGALCGAPPGRQRREDQSRDPGSGDRHRVPGRQNADR